MSIVVNLTPHTLNIVCARGTTRAVPASGQVVRVATERRNIDRFAGINFNRVVYGPLQGLDLEALVDDAGCEHVVLLVSGMVLCHPELPRDTEAFTFASPGELIRNDEGQPIGCDGLTMR